MSTKIDTQKLQSLINNPRIQILSSKDHSKASDKNIEVLFTYEEGRPWEGFIPYAYRRTGLSLATEEEIADYLEGIYPTFSEAAIATWVSQQRSVKFGPQTQPFFEGFLTMDWVKPGYGLPNDNGNQASRVRDVKDRGGYVIVADTSRTVNGTKGHFYRLLPLPPNGGFTYEVFSKTLKEKILRAYDNVDAYEYRKTPGLLPDHKFPEIRWGRMPPAENPDTMSVEEIQAKFQLLSNQRNQQKREICRNCYNTGKRGIIAGIDFFYAGDENWPASVPATGADAEQGCIGCGWYDMPVWRASLNARLGISQEAAS